MTDSADEKTQNPARGLGKINARVKHNMIACFDRVGGLDALVQWAGANQTEFYRLWAKLLPVQMKHSGKLNHDHAHVHSAVSETAEWVARSIGDRAEVAPPKSLPH